MKQLYCLLLLPFLFACGEDPAFTFEQYSRQHEEAHHQHVQLLKSNIPMANILFGQFIEALENHKSKEQLILTWEHLNRFLETTLDQSSVYSHNIILTDQTNASVMGMWSATSDIARGIAAKEMEIEVAIRGTNHPETVLPEAKELQEFVRKQLAKLQKNAEAYERLCKAGY